MTFNFGPKIFVRSLFRTSQHKWSFSLITEQKIRDKKWRLKSFPPAIYLLDSTPPHHRFIIVNSPVVKPNQIERLKSLNSSLLNCSTVKEKVRVIDKDSRVKEYFKSRSKNGVAGFLQSVDLDVHELFLLKCLVAAGQEHVISSGFDWVGGSEFESARGSLKGAFHAWRMLLSIGDNGSYGGFGKKSNVHHLKDEHARGLKQLLNTLADVEKFYDCIGGIIGYVVEQVLKMHEGRPHAGDMIANGEIQLMVITSSEDSLDQIDWRQLRRMAISYKVPVIMTVAGALASAEGIKSLKCSGIKMIALQDFFETVDNKTLQSASTL